MQNLLQSYLSKLATNDGVGARVVKCLKKFGTKLENQEGTKFRDDS